ncbi:serine hydrolase domain-containing protein [Arsukibacterium indicum]|uniref:Beta-lactamase family protein n=1 Tax=Arsukibacterium indicum TaxID=2848612 RepID=A0ABS6MNT2_9GAMM|nr:serine hydrolase domain-containing protein [Arsukibacterium indicum]MBV2130482.1 beta-lactamase family protein [Arsukibacterium indicum]
MIAPAIDNIIKQQTKNDHFAGVVMIANGDETLHAAAYGEVLPGSGVLHQLGSVWRWASVTKMLAGFITLQEVERGRLNLDQPVAQLLPAAPSHVGGVTLRQLMNHTSGLANPDQTALNTETGVHHWASAAEPDFKYCYGPALAAPGERFDYNACDFVVLADVLKAVTGSNFAELIDHRISKTYQLPSIRVVTNASDDAEVAGTRDGKPIQDGLRLANLSADAAIIGKPADLLKLTQLYMAGSIITDTNLRQEFGRGTPELGYIALTVWGYHAQLNGCSTPVHIIERRGHLPGTKVLTLQAPELGRSMVLFSNRDETDWGWIWQQTGFSFNIASEVFCR